MYHCNEHYIILEYLIYTKRFGHIFFLKEGENTSCKCLSHLHILQGTCRKDETTKLVSHLYILREKASHILKSYTKTDMLFLPIALLTHNRKYNRGC